MNHIKHFHGACTIWLGQTKGASQQINKLKYEKCSDPVLFDCSETQNNMAGSTISSTDKYEFPEMSETMNDSFIVHDTASLLSSINHVESEGIW